MFACVQVIKTSVLSKYTIGNFIAVASALLDLVQVVVLTFALSCVPDSFVLSAVYRFRGYSRSLSSWQHRLSENLLLALL